ncbi:MAG: MarR family transcriptional regulator [Chloroflexi bacterium]|nr:MAG: MarR family transcriptional regulator [Chloroflexota bacterium]MBL1193340.1 MarR family transcriptional regulator [Chloroflexota bacterium]NOH10632.1 MarR family transcriptional regulator [Chloroflexota bacterium]
MKQKQRKQYAEEFGLAFEQFGITRMAGRILGWLLVCEPPHQSPQDLQDALQASKGSISTNTRMLERLNFVERISLPGDRRTYFQVKADAWSGIMQTEVVALEQFQNMTRRGLEQMDNEPEEQRRRLQEMHDFFQFIQKELVTMMKHWEESKTI